MKKQITENEDNLIFGKNAKVSVVTLSLSNVVFIKLINVEMPTIVGILTFMSRTKFVFS